MAFGFVKKTWKDRISEYPTRRTLTKEDGSTELVTVSRSEGTVSQEGDAFSADNMNDLETRVDNALTEANSNLDKQWIKIADANINGTVSFPNYWKEILVTARRSSDNQYFCTINVPVILVENRNITVQFGAGRGSGGYDIKYQMLISKTGAQNIYVYINSQQITDGFVFEFYYK